MSQTHNYQWYIRCALQRLQKMYSRNPWVFMTEADIQCALYSILDDWFYGNKRSKVKDINEKKIREASFQLFTKSLHAELSTSRRKSTEYVDLCIAPPKKIEFWIKTSQYNRYEKNVPVWGWSWDPETAIGIEIKFNRWIAKTSAYSKKTKKRRVTQKWKDYCASLAFDLKKLKRYKRGWLIFVDQYSLFESKKEWRIFMDKIIRQANYGAAKKTLNAYYLCPKNSSAWAHKSAVQTSY